MSPSTLSRTISGFEHRLGVRLFNRTTRNVSLTEAGSRFLSRLSPALLEVEAALESITGLGGTLRGTLRINATEGLARIVLEPIVLAFLRRYPEMEIDLVVEGRMVDLAAGGFDLGIGLSAMISRDMVSIPCGPPLRFAVVGSPTYFQTYDQPVTPTDLERHHCIVRRFPDGTSDKWKFTKDGEWFEAELRGPLSLDSQSLMVDAALQGIGLANVVEWFASEHVRAGRLVRVLEGWSPSSPGLCLYFPQSRQHSSSLRAFVDFARTATAS
jgi:DNA-binding transcriptional LysR family regulator